VKRSVAASMALLLLSLSPAGASRLAKPASAYIEMTHWRDSIVVHKDATFVETMSYTIKVLNREAIDTIRTQQVSYSASMSEIRNLTAYTIKANGTRIAVAKENYQNETESGEAGKSPLMTDIATKTIVYPDVEVGDSIELSYERVQHQAPFPNEFSDITAFPDFGLVDDAEYRLDAPKDLPMSVSARDFAGGEITASGSDGMRHWVWHFARTTFVPPTNSWSVDMLDYAPRILVSTFHSYGDLAQAYEQRARQQSVLTPRLRELADHITRGASNQRSIVTALAYWVAGNIRYVDNSTGINMLVPHNTDHILDNRIGDCKDHALLLQALLAAKNIPSTAVLINADYSYQLPDTAVAALFNHVITYVPSLNVYIDSTAEPMPLGTLPRTDEGKPTIHTVDFHGIQYTPATDNTKNWGKTTAETTYHQDGSADGLIQTQFSGAVALRLRRIYQALMASPYKDVMMDQFLKEAGLHGSGKYLSFENLDTISDTFGMKIQFHIDNALDFSGPGSLAFGPPIPGQDVPLSVYATTPQYDRPLRDFPCSGGSSSVDIIAHFPKHVTIMAIPKDVHLHDAMGIYDAVYKQDGDTVIAKRSISSLFPGNVCSPAAYDAARPHDMAVRADLKRHLYFR
jgi:transglutaminase-like putative cysteine protease